MKLIGGVQEYEYHPSNVRTSRRSRRSRQSRQSRQSRRSRPSRQSTQSRQKEKRTFKKNRVNNTHVTYRYKNKKHKNRTVIRVREENNKRPEIFLKKVINRIRQKPVETKIIEVPPKETVL